MAKAVSVEEEALAREEYDRLLRLPPETAGESIVRGIERRRARVLVGSDARIISLLERALRSRAPFFPGFGEALANARLLEAARQSAASGAPVAAAQGS